MADVKGRSGRRALATGALLLGLTVSGLAQEATLRFAEPMATVINARCWDETQEQWLEKREADAPLFFDAVHRFLLMRFPNAAEVIHAKVTEGFRVVSATLVLHYDKHEWLRVPGYRHRGYALKGQDGPKWHAQVWALRRSWIADRELGPTWNAAVNGLLYWDKGGGWSHGLDRSAEPQGKAGLWPEHAIGEVDVTPSLIDGSDGTTFEQRLRRLADCGFLIQKAELSEPFRGEKATVIGCNRIWVTAPELVVVLERDPNGARARVLPPPVDVRALAAKLTATGPQGLPSTRIPEKLQALAAAYRIKPADMPDWMWQRVRELRELRTPSDKRYASTKLFDQLESGRREDYDAAMELILSSPPGWFMGHSHLDFMLPLLCYDDMLPEVVRYHLRKYFESRWTPPYDEKALQTRVGYHGGMATFNHQNQFRNEALLAGEVLGMTDLAIHGYRNLSLLNRQMIFNDGTIQERGDTFYLGISLGTLGCTRTFSVDPLARLKADIGAEKVIFECNATYHPGLRRRVSRVARRYRIEDLVLAQDVPRGILHTLSRKGVLIETDKLHMYPDPVLAARLEAGEKLGRHQASQALGTRTVNFHACQPDRVALCAPWGAEWEANVTDEKPLPFLTVSTDYVRALLKDPVYNVTYLARNYGLASVNLDNGVEWPMVATWRRKDRDVEHLEELGLLWMWTYANGQLANFAQQQEPRSVRNSPLRGMLQHRNKLIHLTRPVDQAIAKPDLKDGLGTLSSRVIMMQYDQPNPPKVFVNGEAVTSFPASAKMGDVITIDEGVTYVGLIPIPSTVLGDDTPVSISYMFPRLELSATLLARPEGQWLSMDAPEALEPLSGIAGGWVVELGDTHEHGSFAAFGKHMQRAALTTRWAGKEKVYHVAYSNGGDTLEIGYGTGFTREARYPPISPPQILAYERVNGKSPWPVRGIDLDCPLGQLGKGEILEKGGAVLRTVVGQPAMLRIEPISGTYEGVNPFIDPTSFELSTPEGAVVRSEGPLGCGRITIRPKENTLWVDYHLPPPEGDLGVELLQADARKGLHGGHPDYEAPLSRFFRPGVDVRLARKQSSRALLVAGLSQPPTVYLNKQALSGPFQTISDGKQDMAPHSHRALTGGDW
ncbi:MAG: hypothetical protein HN742_15880 [Lentisphaerae bacterium]|jgi:hypothetical protein|nr:hypothetical protein [Lentisphaerota bacterium]MBT5605835.1 hypothetical protein [Lentisphaerota bacterium]MBT7061308.1 hypothetical protein [Lentisphaerota bacterium]MBT7843356.1 hypothetical protein [Lentisphaerota bacterium]